jgi:hypothetical protein
MKNEKTQFSIQHSTFSIPPEAMQNDELRMLNDKNKNSFIP